MESLKQKITELGRKYRYFLLVLLVGIFLITLPTGKKAQPAIQAAAPEETDMETRLCRILGSISGVGNVRVMLTAAAGEETLYQNDLTQSDASGRSDTVLVTDASHNQSGLVRQVKSPVYLGAIVVCQGGDRPGVQLSVAEAVAKVTGLKYSQITVLKMK